MADASKPIIEGTKYVSSMSYIKNFFFVFVFILSFSLIKQSDTELFGLGLFFAINMMYCIGTVNDVLKQMQVGSDEQKWRGGVLIVVMAFSFVSTILLAMTISRIQSKFIQKHRILRLGENDARDLDKAETIFITITVFMWALALYTFKTSDQINKTMFLVGHKILGSMEVSWIRVLFAVATFSVGVALYSRLGRESILVNNSPEEFCRPDSEAKLNGVSMSMFKDNFVKTFWFLFAYVFMKILRPVIESNSLPLFQRNGMGYAKDWVGNAFSFKDPIFATNRSTPDWGLDSNTLFSKFAGLFTLRWHTLYILGMRAFGLAALVYASYSIRDFQQLGTDPCMMKYARIRQLFIAFIFFLICLYTVNVLSAYQLTTLITKIMKYLVPPTALALSSYLVYLTNSMTHLSAQQIVE